MATGACAVLAGPLTDGVVQGLGRQRGEDVVEGGDCGRGVALLARAPERTHCLELLLGEQGGELGERVPPLPFTFISTAVNGTSSTSIRPRSTGVTSQ